MPDKILLPSTMKGVYLPGNRQCIVRELAVTQPGPGQVLVEMRASAICGSDLSYIYRSKGHDASGPAGYLNVVAGHEPSGLIVKRGEEVSDDWKEGTRVVVYHIQGCSSCHYCRLGLYISCEGAERKAYGWQRNGGHGEYLLADVQSLVRLPDPLTFLDGAIIACGLGTAYAACCRAQVSGSDYILVVGLGPVGLGVSLLAQQMGAKVLGLDLNKSRVDFASSLGIEAIACSKNKEGQVDSKVDLKIIMTWTENKGVDVAVDCSGSSSARLICMEAARSWARVVFVGEKGEMEDLVERLVWWNLHPEIMVTNTFDIDHAAQAYETFDGGKTGKCAILFKGEKQIYQKHS
ncbi:oxidoreductase [Pyrrhoderma noxium]|uniref:Oxidoreductase n=1 Tax=Pyrrhoderma noxium TaxID=2282107 RepID=A0A286UX01_9AGAM|nr:oxidoreductase [Pyrrhoderma noxium]